MRPIYAFAAGIAATIAVIVAMSAQEISAEEEASAEAAEEQSEGSDRYSELVKVDGAFRETPEKVMHFNNRQALAVEIGREILEQECKRYGLSLKELKKYEEEILEKLNIDWRVISVNSGTLQISKDH